MTDPLGQSQVLPYIKGLSKKGYQFHLISFEKSDRFSQHKKLIQSLCDEDNIVWHPQYYSKEGGLLSTLKQVRKLKRVSSYLHEKHSFEIVHCRSYISALTGLRLKNQHGVKFIFDMRGFWADERVEGGLWNLKNPIYRLIYNYFKRKEIKFFRDSDYTISLTEQGRKEIESWKELQNCDLKIQIIPCCVDLNKFSPDSVSEAERNELKSTLGIQPNDFILGYVGSIGTWYMLPEMLDYFRVLKQENQNAKFVFITGEKPDNIRAAGKQKGIDPDDLLIMSVLHHKVPACISLFDQSIFFIRPTFSKTASSPTKQGEIMAMGVPLICNSGIGDTSEIVIKYNSGLVIDKFDDETYLETIKNKNTFDSQQVSLKANDVFSLEKGVEKYLQVYESVLDK